MAQQEVQGILCMHKPQEFTSFDVIGKLRGILHMKRLGHTGTLDPMATGVLPILVGRAARACDILTEHDKCYRASFQLGLETETEDVWGQVVKRYPDMHVTREEILQKLPLLTGEIQQIPPMYSAVSVNGQRLYELARKGIVIDRPARTVQVYRLELTKWDEATQQGELELFCGKGTYVRTIISDLGRLLGGGAIMTALCRTMACGFTLEDCYSFEDVKAFCEQGELSQHLVCVDRLFASLPELHFTEKQAFLYGNGVKLALSRMDGIQEGVTLYRVYDEKNQFMGTALAEPETDSLRIGKNFR